MCTARKLFLGDAPTLQDSIFTDNDDMFQNSPIHLLFYEKKYTLDDQKVPKLSSMSYCKLTKGSASNLPDLAYEFELLLLLQGVTGQFVTRDQYEHLLFILGQKPISTEKPLMYKDILLMFELFHTSTVDNI